MMNDMMIVLLSFREDYVAAVGDLKKMYNSVLLSISDQHLHRVVWRDLDTHRDFDHYMLQTVPFGDRPSGTIAIVAVRKTANRLKADYPEEAEIIKNKSYVDDICFSSGDHQKSHILRKNIKSILKKGNFRIKQWIVSGRGVEACSDEEESLDGSIREEENLMQLLEEKVLGMFWEPLADVFKFKINVSFGGEELRRPQFDETVATSRLTRRTILSQIAKVFDPYGLLTPFMLSAKLLMRQMCNEDVKSCEWDASLDPEMLQKWIKFFRTLFEVEELRFSRCVKPRFAIKNPILVVFSDGSDLSYGCCAYVRWEVAGGTYAASLLAAKKSHCTEEEDLNS